MGTGLLPHMTDGAGRCLPAYMTDGEIRAELGDFTEDDLERCRRGDRRGELLAEVKNRRAARRGARSAAARLLSMYRMRS